MLANFFQKCRENLHVLLGITPTGANLRERMRKFRSLVNCSTVLAMETCLNPSQGAQQVWNIRKT